jgi:hypothetical protein
MARKKNATWKKTDLIAKVVEMSCSGQSQQEILRWLQVVGECGIDWAYTIIREAKPIINAALTGLAEERLNMTIAELERQKYDAMTSNDKRLVLEIQKEINKVGGLHQQKMDVTTGGEKLNQISVIKLIEVKKDDDVNE